MINIKWHELAVKKRHSHVSSPIVKNVSQTHLLAIREQSSISAAPAVVPPLRHLAPVTGKMARVWRLWMGVVAYRGRPAAVLA